MTVPTTNVKFSDIWSEANGVYSSGLLSLNTMSFFSYFTGPNGSGNQPNNNWGQGEGHLARRGLWCRGPWLCDPSHSAQGRYPLWADC